MRSESRRNGLTCCGWCAARHASINPSYLTEGYKSTDNNQTTGQNPTVHKGFSHIRRMSTRL
ncbi:conjugal transfer protein [Blautia sp. AM28-27]|nr:conjugal transfer protein [Blautia sp. AM28-36]RHT64449.1 conjugal transfer protein [Blautia sp. AM28-27]RHT82785.1 conjugal transfer protein [Blautia sp. AM28-10]RHU81313.1 conjugal transfer protein [Clostridiaceae bacterium OM08-6BH]